MVTLHYEKSLVNAPGMCGFPPIDLLLVRKMTMGDLIFGPQEAA
jgi:hypothetical protein